MKDEKSYFTLLWDVYIFTFSLFSTIPPEQQAEADELAAAVSELKATTVHECQEVVGVNETQSEKYIIEVT